jgi:hypothetical protein
MTKWTLLLALAAAATLLVAPAPASAAPSWRITSVANTNAAPGGQLHYVIHMLNLGPGEVSGGTPSTLTIELPEGMTASGLTSIGLSFEAAHCPGGVAGKSTLTCTASLPVPARTKLASRLVVNVSPGAAGLRTAHFEVSAEGSSASTVDPTMITEAQPGFGFDAFDVQTTGSAAGGDFTQAAGHPYSIVTSIDTNRFTDPQVHSSDPLKVINAPVEPTRDIFAELPPGLIGNPTGAAKCTLVELAFAEPASPFNPMPLCPPASHVGNISLAFTGDTGAAPLALYNLTPPPGVAARFGFSILGTVIVLDAALRSGGDYGITVSARNSPEVAGLSGSVVEFWGDPGSALHDFERACPGEPNPYQGGPICPGGGSSKPFLRLPTRCTATGEGLPWSVHTDSWYHPGALGPDRFPDLSDADWKSTSIVSHKAPGYPASPNDPGTPWGAPEGTTDCADVPVKGTLSAQPTTLDTESPSGLLVNVEIPNPGLENPAGIASSDIKAVEVTLPEGVTINPSQAEGLGVCTPAQYESSELSFHPDGTKGCPSASKIGTVSVQTPLLEEAIEGNVYVAEPFENPFDSLLAIYVVLENPQRGILVKLAGKVSPDPKTGQIIASFENLPQLPFSNFEFRFREGARAPLVTPRTCGSYETEAVFTPWSDPAKKLSSKSSFQITRGIGGGPCPQGNVPPFNPGFRAGSLNNNAGSYSPFLMRLTRNDGEQGMTKFSALLPPGVSAKIAGVSKCPEAAIALAREKTGIEERESPSCPARSEIGEILAGAGVGSVLTYVGGKLYLAGPYNGAPLSVVAITPAVAGPFDVGTVIVREALTLDPKTAEVRVDGDRSDPIPHILAGIPLSVRDIRVNVNRPNFTINPTSCDPSAVGATLFGSFLDVLSPHDDRPVSLSERYQAANCLNLGFKPRLSLKLKGGTKRGQFPGLRAIMRPRPGDANLEKAVVSLPRSAFLEQGHIRTICTRVQFAADSCPAGSIYGHAKAYSPLLEEPLQGPVYLRSSDHNLPDLVLALKGIVEIEASGRIDSIKGRIRSTFEAIPDAPISEVILTMRGGQKGLIVNSRNLCRGKPQRANVELDAQSGKTRDFKPKVGNSCRKQAKRNAKRRNANNKQR